MATVGAGRLQIGALDSRSASGAVRLVATALRARSLEMTGCATPPPRSLDVAMAARVLSGAPGGESLALVATDGDAVLGVLVADVHRSTANDPAYTYQPPLHAAVPVTGWALAPGAEDVARPLWNALHDELVRRDVPRAGIQVLAGDWRSTSIWSRVGLRREVVLAGRPLIGPSPEDSPDTDAVVRPASVGDHATLTSLALHEHAFHARHTGSGVAAVQSHQTVSAIAGDWLDPHANPETERALVAERSGRVVGMTTVHVDSATTPSPSQYVLPEHMGYVGLTCVHEDHRGHGVGQALSAASLQWFRTLPDPPSATWLHYVADNAVAEPFWTRQGYAPVVVQLTDASAGPVART